ncbi:MAG: phage capsid protein [Pseudomonadota bacterium]
MNMSPVPVDPVLTAISVAYANQSYIADEVLPKVKVDGAEFKYTTYRADESYTPADTAVGRHGVPNNVQTGGVLKPAACVGHGLRFPIPQEDIDKGRRAGRKPINKATVLLTDQLMLARERRVAGLVFDADQYPTSQKVTLSGKSQFTHADSTPLEVIDDAMKSCLIFPNRMVLGAEAYHKLARHPHMVKAVHGNSGDVGKASPQQIAEHFGLDKVLVGNAKINTAAEGKDMALGNVWEDSIALFYQSPTPDADGPPTFGITGEYKTRAVRQWPEKNLGGEGGIMVQVYESLAELIIAPLAGYLIKDVLA